MELLENYFSNKDEKDKKIAKISHKSTRRGNVLTAKEVKENYLHMLQRRLRDVKSRSKKEALSILNISERTWRRWNDDIYFEKNHNGIVGNYLKIVHLWEAYFEETYTLDEFIVGVFGVGMPDDIAINKESKWQGKAIEVLAKLPLYIRRYFSIDILENHSLTEKDLKDLFLVLIYLMKTGRFREIRNEFRDLAHDFQMSPKYQQHILKGLSPKIINEAQND